MSGLDGARVRITGGAGLIGSHIAGRYIDADVREIVVLDDLRRGRVENLAAGSARGEITLFEDDTRDRRLVAEAQSSYTNETILGTTDKAERLLGFRAGVGLANGLRRLVTWKRSGPGALFSGGAVVSTRPELPA